MDEFRRMGMGMAKAPPPQPPTSPKQSLASQVTSHRGKPFSGDSYDDPFDPEDFTDIFGGPPSTILSHQFSRSSGTSFFYEGIFLLPENVGPAVGRIGRKLPEFKIPEIRRNGNDQKNCQNGFYSDIFEWDEEKVVRSKTSSSSELLSSGELSPLSQVVSDGDGDSDVSSFASKLRPIDVRCRWNSTTMGHEVYQRLQKIPPFEGNQHIYSSEYVFSENLRNYPFGLIRRNASPETGSPESVSNGSFRVFVDDFELNLPSSTVSSVSQSGQEQMAREIEEDEATSSYVIGINSDNREGICESNGIDEAIAWAKEKFQKHCSESKWSKQEQEQEKPAEERLNGHQLSEVQTDNLGSKVQTEIQITDEKVRMWSTGKEADIRLLLSTMHHILWPNSGWLAIPLKNLIKSSEVKKAYQKARLCLHPDKLQQRGATLPQKYIAEKAFSVLQDAWTAFISLDVFCS